MKRTYDGSLDPTLTPTESPTLDVAKTHPVEPQSSVPAQPASHYEVREPLGRGGMGEVVLADDKKIGRSVALKRMRAAEPSPDAVTRFLREAHIQARLEHPAIVPVHEIAHDEHGRPYFTMKRLSGTTLYEALKAGEPQRRLLRAFVDVCLAIDFAHHRGFVHRDLKPSNIMLGNFGEVYVLDWGVARVIGETELAGVDIASFDGGTQAGAVLGTPGYMSPEQARGEEITTATDVYALGTLLFEILVGESVHPRGAALVSTLATEIIHRPTRRKPNLAIAPELDDICAVALLAAPDARPTARELADRVQRYLDGDRDVAHRRELASSELAAAHAAVTAGDRAEAMRLAGRALALHPESRDAASLVTQLMLEPPSPPPRALAQRLHDIDRDDMARQGRYAAFALTGYLIFVPVVAAIGVTQWSIVAAAAAVVISMQIGAAIIAKKRIPRIGWAVWGNAILLVLLSRLFSPLILGPALAVAAVAALSAFPTLRPATVIAAGVAGAVVPLVLEMTGVIPPTVTFSSTQITIAPGAIELGATSTPLLLTATHIAVISIVALVVRSLALARREAQRKLEGQSWMLEQLIPVERA